MPFGVLDGFDLHQCQIELENDLLVFPTCLRAARCSLLRNGG